MRILVLKTSFKKTAPVVIVYWLKYFISEANNQFMVLVNNKTEDITRLNLSVMQEDVQLADCPTGGFNWTQPVQC